MSRECGTCAFNSKDESGYLCNNPESENYGVYTFFDDTCEEWEEK